MSKRIRSILIWIAIQTFVGILIFFFSKGFESESPIATFFIIQWNSHFIALSSMMSGTLFYKYSVTWMTSAKLIHFLTIITSGIAAILAALLCILLYSFLQNIIPLANPQPSQYLTGLILPAAIMGILISSFTLEVMDNSKATDLRNNETELPEKAVEKHSFPGLAVRQGTRHTIVAYPDIVFIQARGKRSVIHTETEQFVAAKLLREFLPSLPPALFLRIHRGYIVNLKWIREMEYDIGGSYIARLKDEDETELPVSRDTANLLKINLGIATKKNLYTNS